VCVRKTINNIIISLNKVNSMLLLHTPYKENFLRFFRFLLTVPIQLYKYFILVTVKQAFFRQAREFLDLAKELRNSFVRVRTLQYASCCVMNCHVHANMYLQVLGPASRCLSSVDMHDGQNFMQIHFLSFNPCLVLKPDLFSSYEIQFCGWDIKMWELNENNLMLHL